MLCTPVCLFINFYQIFYVNSYDGEVYGRANSKFFAQEEISTFIDFVKQQLTRKVLGNLFSWRTKKKRLSKVNIYFRKCKKS